MGNPNRLLPLILLIALLLRVGWAVSRPVDDAAVDQLPDQREYLEIARSFLRGEGLSFADPRFVQTVYAYRTPGYPLFLAACGANVRVARVGQCLLDTSTILAAYLLARRWLNRGPSLFAAALVALNPFLVYFCGLLLTETLFTALLAWGMVLLLSRRTVPWLFGGAILALSVLVRPGALAMPIMLGVLAAVVNRRSEGPYHRRWPLPVATTMLLLTLLALLPWAVRNHRVVGRWVWTSTNAGITSYDGFNPDATGGSDQSFVRTMPQLRNMNETERNDYLASLASQYLRQNPRRSLDLAGAKVARTWSPRPLSSEFSRPEYVAAALGYSVPFDVLVLIGLFAGRLPRAAKVFLVAPAVYLTLGAAMSVGSLRYRVPAEVPLAMLAAGSLGWLAAQMARSDNLPPAEDTPLSDGASSDPPPAPTADDEIAEPAEP